MVNVQIYVTALLYLHFFYLIQFTGETKVAVQKLFQYIIYIYIFFFIGIPQESLHFQLGLHVVISMLRISMLRGAIKRQASCSASFTQSWGSRVFKLWPAVGRNILPLPSVRPAAVILPTCYLKISKYLPAAERRFKGSLEAAVGVGRTAIYQVQTPRRLNINPRPSTTKKCCHGDSNSIRVTQRRAYRRIEMKAICP